LIFFLLLSSLGFEAKALELFMQNLVDVAAERARQGESTKLEAIYL
jgi:hypothetical protein